MLKQHHKVWVPSQQRGLPEIKVASIKKLTYAVWLEGKINTYLKDSPEQLKLLPIRPIQLVKAFILQLKLLNSLI